MHIGLLTTGFPRFEGDIAGSFVLDFGRALSARGHRVSVMAPQPAQLLEKPSWPGVELHWFRYFYPRSLQRTFYGAGVPDNLRGDPWAALATPPAVAAMAATVLMQRTRWDALVTHWALPCGLLGACLRGARRHLAVVHSADLHLLERLPGRGPLASRLLHGSDGILFMTAEQRQRFLTLLPDALRATGHARCHVQAMGVDVPELLPLQQRKQRKRFVLLTLARLVPIKGLDEALVALRDRDDLEWWIAGEGPQAPRLVELARGAQLKVRLLGHVSGRRKNELLQDADAFLLPSRVMPSGRSEGLPVAVLEAMAHGLPVIASRVGGLPELLGEEQAGLLFDAQRPNTLRAAIQRLQHDDALRSRLGASARARAEHYAWPKVAARVEAWLR